MTELSIWKALYVAAVILACAACEGWRRALSNIGLHQSIADWNWTARQRAEADLATEQRIVGTALRERDAWSADAKQWRARAESIAERLSARVAADHRRRDKRGRFASKP